MERRLQQHPGMGFASRLDGIDIGENQRFHGSVQKARQAASILMAALVLLALSGLFGSGPISSSVAGQRHSPIWVEYDRFVRRDAPMELKVHLTPADASGGQLELKIDNAYLNQVELHGIVPPPGQIRVSGNQTVCDFAAVHPNHEMTIQFFIEPNNAGVLRGGIEANGHAQTVNQFVYP